MWSEGTWVRGKVGSVIFEYVEFEMSLRYAFGEDYSILLTDSKCRTSTTVNAC